MTLLSSIRSAVLAALFVGAACAVSFGGLTITPRGPQALNLDTGLTELPQGGKATDSRGQLTLDAQRMQFKPGAYLIASGVTLTTRQGGTLKAAQVRYDLAASTVTASGDVTYTDARLKALSAEKITLDVRTGFVVASGGVTADTPQLSGRVLVFDPATMQAVLGGPYSARQGTLNASGGANDRLLMVFGGNRVVRSSTEPDADGLARFLPYLK
ncbi:hypothetical protein HNQ07_002724 [Deinococcus metalli]|uniref:LPS export ABC transporter periplasmic protein LptC n=1 Tax=Deinococcus metalli TaxID=1141878 RepID=A0A7W8KHR7_9DEIO|nr:hypothetical protein [Deinococcus metalli]MBB5377251.1 hypothetical protein [Deinococcus metalli]GHF47868.1 hypothetical protein GCM10017781_25250 [Deinococcus metalli]